MRRKIISTDFIHTREKNVKYNIYSKQQQQQKHSSCLLSKTFIVGDFFFARQNSCGPKLMISSSKKKIIYFNILKHMYFCIQTNTYNSNKNVSSQQKSFFFFGGDIFVTNINFSCKYVMCWNHKIAISDAKISWRHPKNNNLPNIY